MAAEDESWKYEVRKKLAAVFEDQIEDLCRILFFLDEEDKAYMNNVSRPYAPQWRSLKATLKNGEAFRNFAMRLADETKRAEKDQEFRKRMNAVHEEMAPHCEKSVAIEKYQKGTLARLVDGNVISTTAFCGLARAWAIIPAESKASVLRFIESIATNINGMSSVDGVLSLTEKFGGSIAMVGLAAVHMSFAAYHNIKRWWKGEISGKRCVKNLLDSMLTTTAGVAGGVAGAALGSLGGPIGTVVGGVIGGVISGSAVNYLSDLLTQKVFGIPKDEALENAYLYLGVKMTASNAEINSNYRKMALQHHPDKPGGSAEDFLRLQCHLAVIKQARGEF